MKPKYTRYNSNGKIERTVSNGESIFGQNARLNELEAKLYGNTDRWFYLESIELDSIANQLAIVIRPNDDQNDRRTFLFSQVKELRCATDEEQEPKCFPQQIFGVDFVGNAQSGYRVTIACDEAEYAFETAQLPWQQGAQ